MAKSLFNAANHEISERVLKSGNYLAKITSIEDQEKGRGNQFVLKFLAPEGQIRQGFWYDHEVEAAERIGKNDLKRICIFTGNRDIDLQEDPRTWEPLKDKPIAIAVRRQKDKEGKWGTYTKDGVTYDSYEIQFFASSKEELPEYNPRFDEIDEEEDEEDDAPAVKPQTPDVDQIMKNVSRGGSHEPAEFHADPPAGAPNPKEETPVEDDVPF
jgi:hypothetical protein